MAENNTVGGVRLYSCYETKSGQLLRMLVERCEAWELCAKVGNKDMRNAAAQGCKALAGRKRGSTVIIKQMTGDLGERYQWYVRVDQ